MVVNDIEKEDSAKEVQERDRKLSLKQGGSTEVREWVKVDESELAVLPSKQMYPDHYTVDENGTKTHTFAPMIATSPASTIANLNKERLLPLKHAVTTLSQTSINNIADIFDDITSCFKPQPVDYSNPLHNEPKWLGSCFMEYESGIAQYKRTKKIDLSMGEKMFSICKPLLLECDDIFLKWYDEMYRRNTNTTIRTVRRLQSFVTRYTTDFTALKRHIDGLMVSGSIVLGLPTKKSFGYSGGLSVWDGRGDEVFHYPVASGDVILLDRAVWHQADPITHGERWVIVIFYKVTTTKQSSA